MSDSPVLRADRSDAQLTEAHHGDGRGIPACKMRLGRCSNPSTGFTDEMSCLLRTRLRLAILIILAGFALHFLRNLLVQGTAFDHRPLWLFFSGCEIAVMAIVSGLLWSRRPLSRRSLRVLELTIFGMIAAFFAWVQLDTYHDGALLRSVVPGQEGIVFRLVGVAATLRWFLLIVL